MTGGLLLQWDEGGFSWPSRSRGPVFFLLCLSSILGASYFYSGIWTTLTIWENLASTCSSFGYVRFRMKGLEWKVVQIDQYLDQKVVWNDMGFRIRVFSEWWVVWKDRWFWMTGGLLLQWEEGVFSWASCSSGSSFILSSLSSISYWGFLFFTLESIWVPLGM